ncbi:MAG: hypothetical protein ACYTDY_02085, partial [Planctomycetota bacterium]
MRGPWIGAALLLLVPPALGQLVEPGEGRSKPYAYSSLAKLSDAEILRYMSEGRDAWDALRESVVPTHLPEGFWEMEPRRAALAYADANRTEEHREAWRLETPEQGSAPQDRLRLRIVLRLGPARDSRDRRYFHLTAEGDECSLAEASTYEIGRQATLRRLELDPTVARHVLHTVWWLRRLRAVPLGEAPWGRRHRWAGSVGGAELELHDGAGSTLRAHGPLWRNYVSERYFERFVAEDWRWGDETFLNLAAHLVTKELPVRLGARWAEAGASISTWRGSAPSKSDIERLRRVVSSFLDLASADEKRLPLDAATIAAWAAAEAGLVVQAPALDRLRERLGPDRSVRPGLRDPLFECRAALGAALDALAIARNPKALKALALGQGRRSRWAERRLGHVAPGLRLDVLEHWILEPRGGEDVSAMKKLAAADRERALRLIEEIGPRARPRLTTVAYDILRERGPFPRDAEWIQAMMEHPTAGTVRALVPPENPLRVPSAEIDRFLAAV